MPNNYNFSLLENVKEININPKGWVNPIIVEYGTNYYGEVLSYHWRIKGTTHTFIIPVLRIDFLSQGDYVKHFEEVLQEFREDYKGWVQEKFYTKWMCEYRDQYSKFISI